MHDCFWFSPRSCKLVIYVSYLQFIEKCQHVLCLCKKNNRLLVNLEPEESVQNCPLKMQESHTTNLTSKHPPKHQVCMM